jgi:hypothetical protein
LSKQVVSTIDSEGTEISKGNKVIVAFSHSTRAEVGSGAERASVPNTSRAKGRANVSRKRLNRISLNSLSKEAGNSIIPRGRKQKTGHFCEKYTLPESRNTWEGVCASTGDLGLRLCIILISVLSALIGIVEVIVEDLCFSCQSNSQYPCYANGKGQERKSKKKRPLSSLEGIAEFRNTQEIDSSKDGDLGTTNLTRQSNSQDIPSQRRNSEDSLHPEALYPAPSTQDNGSGSNTRSTDNSQHRNPGYKGPGKRQDLPGAYELAVGIDPGESDRESPLRMEGTRRISLSEGEAQRGRGPVGYGETELDLGK